MAEPEEPNHSDDSLTSEDTAEDTEQAEQTQQPEDAGQDEQSQQPEDADQGEQAQQAETTEQAEQAQQAEEPSQPEESFDTTGQQPYQQPYNQQPHYGQQSTNTYQQPYYGQPSASYQQPYEQAQDGQPRYEQPYQQAQPYQQQYQPGQQQYQQPYGYGYQYPFQPPYQPEPEKKKHRVCPWVLVGCLVVFLVFIGGIIGCVSCAVLSYEDSASSDTGIQIPGLTEESPSDGNDYSKFGTYTLDDIKELANGLNGKAENNRCEPGIYTVGQDVKAGFYFVEGNPDEEGYYYLFKKTGDDAYEMQLAIVYLGNYYAELEKDEVLVFMPHDKDSRMYPNDEASFNPKAPYGCGLYRVGTDIPAGTYNLALAEDAAENTDNTTAAYVMSDLKFGSDSITEEVDVIAGSKQTVTVKDGDYLELFAVEATPEK